MIVEGQIQVQSRLIHTWVSFRLPPSTPGFQLLFLTFTPVSSSPKDMNFDDIVENVYGLADSDHAIAPAVKEALEVIDRSLDDLGYVSQLCIQLSAPVTEMLKSGLCFHKLQRGKGLCAGSTSPFRAAT